MTIYRPTVYKILGIIAKNPSISRNDISEKLGVKTQSATIGTGIKTLVEDGLILKDRRTIGIRTAYYVTDKGERTLVALAALEAVQ